MLPILPLEKIDEYFCPVLVRSLTFTDASLPVIFISLPKLAFTASWSSDTSPMRWQVVCLLNDDEDIEGVVEEDGVNGTCTPLTNRTVRRSN